MHITDIKFLYHGSDQYFDKFDLTKSKAAKDFGPGIYMTSNLGQAKKWAERKANRKHKAYVYQVPFLYQRNLREKVFLEYDKSWLDFILANRYQYDFSVSSQYDLIYDRMADGVGVHGKLDYVLPRYSKGDITADEAIEQLQYTNGFDQFCFKTQQALKLLDEGKRIVIEYSLKDRAWTEREGSKA